MSLENRIDRDSAPFCEFPDWNMEETTLLLRDLVGCHWIVDIMNVYMILNQILRAFQEAPPRDLLRKHRLFFDHNKLHEQGVE